MTNDSIRVSKALHLALTQAAHLVRETFAANDVGEFYLAIDVCGRTMTDKDECLVTYHIADGKYGEHTKGNNLDATLTETLRRNGWNRANKPLALPAPTTSKVYDSTDY